MTTKFRVHHAPELRLLRDDEGMAIGGVEVVEVPICETKANAPLFGTKEHPVTCRRCIRVLLAATQVFNALAARRGLSCRWERDE